MKIKPTVYEAMREGLIRTYGDLVQVARASTSGGNCCACHRYGRPTWRLSVRASICDECCKRKSKEVLGSILTSERKARRYVKQAIERDEDMTQQLRFYAHLTGARESYIEAQYRAAKAAIA